MQLGDITRPLPDNLRGVPEEFVWERPVKEYRRARLLGVEEAQAQKGRSQMWVERFGRIDLVVYCAGYYKAMRATRFDLDEMLRHQQVNLTGVWHLLAALLPALLAQGHGHVSLVSSVAGFRGLPRSLAYGPTKAALINLAESLYLDLQPLGLGVSVITPGFVATPLTAGNEFPMPALLTPEQAAAEILRGWERGEFMIHFPKRFSRFLLLLRLLPYRAYFALVRRLTGL